MNSTHFVALAQTFIGFLIMSVSYYGWGRLASTIVRIASPNSISVIPSIWLGWAFSLLIFQVAHFFFPITAYVVIPIFLVGIIISIPHISPIVRSYFRNNNPIFIILSLILFLIVFIWIASRGMWPAQNFDSGLYYLNMIRWTNSYPIVPGLGNLHGRFAFNQSFFTYVAALNLYPFFGHGYSFANSYIFLLTLATIVNFLRPVIYKPSLLIKSHPFRYLPALFSIPFMIYMVFDDYGPVLPMPDLTIKYLQITMILMLLRSLTVWQVDNLSIKGEVTWLAILAATTATIKLSSLPFAAVIICFCIVGLWYSSNKNFRSLVDVVLPCAAILFVFVLRGYILSGAPLYPSTIGYIPFKWAVPYEQVIEEANWVYSWARQPQTHWKNVLGSWNWFRPWLSRVRKDNVVDIIYPLIFAFVSSGLAILSVAISQMKGQRIRFWEWVILLPSIISLICWFFTAPDPRFAGSNFWLLSISSAILLILSLQPLLKKQWLVAALLFVFIISSFSVAQVVPSRISRLDRIMKKGWYPDAKGPVVEKRTSSGLVIYVPEKNQQCWDSPLPCTPTFKDNIRLFDPNYLGSGFYIYTDKQPIISGQGK